jgi:hypothetical protein
MYHVSYTIYHANYPLFNRLVQVKFRGYYIYFFTITFYMFNGYNNNVQPPHWMITSSRLSETAYIYFSYLDTSLLHPQPHNVSCHCDKKYSHMVTCL